MSLAGRLAQCVAVRGTRAAWAAALGLVVSACASSAAPSEVLRLDRAPALADTIVQADLSVPWDLAFASDGRMFVTERMGDLLIFESGKPKARRVGAIKVADVRAMGEAGLMSIALDPHFAREPFVYLCASRTDEGEWRNQVLRYRATGNDLTFDGYLIRSGIAAASVHDGCRLRFGPDGKLWMTMGDLGTGRLAQDPNALAGKVLRIERDGSVPADNPVLPGAKARSYVYTMGHRNPQGLAFAPGSGAVYEVESGTTGNDEINVLKPGANYGWPDVEGIGGTKKGFTDPIWTSGAVTYAVAGAAFLAGPQWGTWEGSLVVATLKEQDLRRFVIDGASVVPKEVLYDGKYGRLRSPVLGPDGALYVTTSNGSGDRIVRIAPQP